MKLFNLFFFILNNPQLNSIHFLPLDLQLKKYSPKLFIMVRNLTYSKEHLKLIFQHSYILISMENQTFPKLLDLNLNFQVQYFLSFFIKIKFKISHTKLRYLNFLDLNH